MKRMKRMIRRRAAFILSVMAAAVIGTLLVAGCGPGSSDTAANEAGRLLQEYPWLGPLGLPYVESLLAQYGSNLLDLLAAALAALAG
jgi:hypothetical protein